VPTKVKCEQCGVETYMPFKCPYCSQYFCVEHRLPENHDCPEYWRAKAPKPQPAKTVGTLKTEPSYQHTVTMMPQRRGKGIWFSVKELKHLSMGILLTLAIGFSMPFWGSSWLYGYPEVLTALAVIFAFSFMTHELAHKIAAQQFGLWAEFRITMFGALITLMSIISPFKIISPGAVMVGGMASRETIGKASVAGPITNIALALILLPFTEILTGVIVHAFEFGVLINSIIALFNLIPFGILDGFKVFLWDKKIWAVAFSASLALTAYSYVIFPLL